MKKITVAGAIDNRTDEERAAAAPLDLPAGSYEAADLNKAVNAAAKLKDDGKREEALAKAVDEHKQGGTDFQHMPGYEKVLVTTESLGITEERFVPLAAAKEDADHPADADPVPPVLPAPEPAAKQPASKD